MQLTPEQETRFLRMLADDLKPMIWEKIERSLDEVICLSFARAAGALELSTQQANKVLTEYVDFGPRDKRVTLAALKRAIGVRTVKPRSRK